MSTSLSLEDSLNIYKTIDLGQMFLTVNEWIEPWKGSREPGDEE